MRYTHFLTTCILAALCAPAYSQINPDLVGSCEIGHADAYLELKNVRARLFNSGNLFWRGSPHVYEVPRGSGVNAIFTDNFVIGGMVDGTLRTAGSTYGPYEFWPGPIPKSGDPPEDCSAFDRFWHVNRFRDMKIVTAAHPVSDAVKDWPTHLGAPFVDVDGIEGYRPEAGDRPFMMGDRMVWWIMNDVGNKHDRMETDPLGIEVRVTAFGFDVDNELGYTTFYRYEVTNRNTLSIRDAFVGRIVDADLGNFDDDRIGSDSTLSMFYFYNADDFDEGEEAYGVAPPAIGLVFLEASHFKKTLPTDVGARPGSFMTSSTHYWANTGINGDVRNGADLYNYMRGNWRNGRQRTEGGYGMDFNNKPSPIWMPGDPVSGSFWSEVNLSGNGEMFAASDKAGVASFGPFDLNPGETATFTFAYVWARGSDNLDSITQLRRVASEIHEISDEILTPRGPVGPEIVDGNLPPLAQFPFWLAPPFPNPASNTLSVEFSASLPGDIQLEVFDILGREALSPTTLQVSEGPNQTVLDVSRLPPGVYRVRLQSWQHTASHSFVVSR